MGVGYGKGGVWGRVGLGMVWYGTCRARVGVGVV